MVELDISGTKVADLSPLAGMKMKRMQMNGTRVRDLSPLRGMPLRELELADCSQVQDFSVLGAEAGPGVV